MTTPCTICRGDLEFRADLTDFTAVLPNPGAPPVHFVCWSYPLLYQKPDEKRLCKVVATNEFYYHPAQRENIERAKEKIEQLKASWLAQERNITRQFFCCYIT